VQGEKIAANIPLGKVNLMLMGQERKAHVVQTVGVLPGFRGLGLVRKLFVEPVKEHLAARGGLSFLLAHPGVLHFYPLSKEMFWC
jgi:predicted acetyltransferase